MSVVACKVLGSGYEIAADSITVRGHVQTKGDNTAMSKLFEVNGLVIGGVGIAEEISIFRLFAGTHKPERATEGALLEYLSEFSNWKKNKTGDGDLDASYLIGISGQVFVIENWLVEKVTTYEAIGAGFSFALTAMHLGHSAEEAVGVATELSIYCEAPIQVIRRP
jgi:ATP-dependent protease HslVU (ClpYQ) peptidase subunit